MTLQADHYRPIVVTHNIANSLADILERDALAECVTVGDDGAFRGGPNIDLHTPCTMR